MKDTTIKLKPKESALVIKENGQAELFITSGSTLKETDIEFQMGIILMVIGALIENIDTEFFEMIGKKGSELMKRNLKKTTIH